MPKSVYSIRAEAALSVHLDDLEKLLALSIVTDKTDQAIREHLAVAKAAAIQAYEHAEAAGHVNEAFQREHSRRMEKLAAMEARVDRFLHKNPPI